MIRFRSPAALLLGVWLGAGIFADIAVTQNFQSVDRFLAQPGSPFSSRELGTIRRDRVRFLLRRNAGEENNWMFVNWERAELVLGIALLLVLAAKPAAPKTTLAGAALMLAIVVTQHFLLSPRVALLGREMADLPAENFLSGRFWTLHGIYSGAEIVKLAIGAALAFMPAKRGAAEAAVR